MIQHLEAIMISGSVVLIGIIDWLYYYLYQPKLQAEGQKGTADWVNERLIQLKDKPKELLEEERLVRIPFKERSPEKRRVILMTHEQSYHVDRNTTHNLALGITGAGKSQTSVFSFIDLISRAPKKGSSTDDAQESMIINDPKGSWQLRWPYY